MKTQICTLLILLTATSFCNADVFLSFTGMNDGNANTSDNAVFGIGDSGVAYIWFTDDTKVDTGAFLDIVSSDPGVVRFTDSEVFNPDIVSGATTVDTRWQSASGGTVGEGLIDEMAGVRFLSGTGILPSQISGSAIEDSLHDATSNAFLFGAVNFEAVSLGDVVLSASVGDGLIVDEGVSLTPNFRSASIGVRAVPEPSSTSLFIAMAMVMVGRRVRNQLRVAL
jgi:hypothetical protein